METQIKTENNQKLICLNDKLLPGNDYKPNVKEGETYELKRSFVCKCGQLHYDVGLRSSLNWVTCYKCTETLPESGHGKTHWANSTRFNDCITSPFMRHVENFSRYR